MSKGYCVVGVYIVMCDLIVGCGGAGGADGSGSGVGEETSLGKSSNISSASVVDSDVIYRNSELADGRVAIISVGTSGTLYDTGDGKYDYPASALVTDDAGQPIENVLLGFELKPIEYRKGTLDNFGIYSVSALCPNEDDNLNELLDPGEDLNSNGTIEPGAVAEVTNVAVTDVNGVADFHITYDKQYAGWANFTIIASITGTEFSTTITSWLPIHSKDVTESHSPYGVASTCSDPY